MTQDYKELIQKQRNYFLSGATRPVSFRKKQLKRLKNLIKFHEEDILEALNKDLKKNPTEAFLSEVGFLYEEINYTLEHLDEWVREESVPTPLHFKPSSAKKIHEPLGVVAIFAPWNYPFQLLIAPLIGAIASGNTSILKPAHQTSHTQKLILKLIPKYFEDHYVLALGGAIPECEQLLKERFDFIFFTGSPRVGKIILQAASQHLTPVCLELGGKSPAIIDQNASLQSAAKRITWAKFLNAGQTCVAPDYIYAHESVYEEFLKACQQSIEQFYTERPQSSDFYGRMINDLQFQRVSKLIESSKVFYGGHTQENERYISPTLLRDVKEDDKIMQEEIFGPLLPVLKFKKLKEVVRLLQEKEKPLALYFFSNSRKNQEYILQNTSSGGACINDCIVHLGNAELPFGGVGNSGMGAYHGKHSFELFSHKKSVHLSSAKIDNPLRYPPFSSKKKKFLSWFFK